MDAGTTTLAADVGTRQTQFGPTLAVPVTSTNNFDTVRISPRIVKAADVVSWIHDHHDRSNRYKLRWQAEWFLNMAYYQGRQGWFDRGSMTFQQPKDPLINERHITNLIRPYCLDLVANMQTGQPQIDVVPATSETEDVMIKEASQMVLDYTDRVTDFESVKIDRDHKRVLMGTSVLRFWIDPDAGATVSATLPGPNGVPVPTTFQEGEIRCAAFDPFDVHFFPFNPAVPANIKGVLFTAYKPVEEMREMFPDDASKIVQAPDINPHEFYRRQLEWLNAPVGVARNMGVVNGQCRVFEYIEAPTKNFPKGKKITVVNDVLCEYGDNPLADLFPPESPDYLKLGIVVYRLFTTPGVIWGVGLPEDLRPIQTRYNRLLTEFERNRRAVGRNKLFAPFEAMIDKDELNNSMTQVVRVKGGIGQQPIHVQPALGLNVQAQWEMEHMVGEFDRVGHRPAVTQGVNPSGQRGGAGIQSLQEAAQVGLSLVARETEAGDADCARIKLALAKRHYSPVKISRICGPQKAFAASAIQQSNLYTDVSVVPGSALPRNRSAWNRNLAELWQMGALVTDDGKPDVRWLRENMDLGGYHFESREQPSIDAQRSEIQVMLGGQFVDIKPWDNDIVHSEQCDKFLEKYPNLKPMQARMILMHQQKHMMRIAKRMIPPVGLHPPMEMQGKHPVTGGPMSAERHPAMAAQEQAA